VVVKENAPVPDLVTEKTIDTKSQDQKQDKVPPPTSEPSDQKAPAPTSTPAQKVEPTPTPTPTPTQPEPKPITIPPQKVMRVQPRLQILSVEPKDKVYYGNWCANEPVQLRVTFTTQSDTPLVTLSASAGISKDEQSPSIWRSLQLYSVGKDQFSILISPKDLSGGLVDTDGYVFYRFELVDEEGLRDEESFHLPLIYCPAPPQQPQTNQKTTIKK
jgi:hypothetical protein